MARGIEREAIFRDEEDYNTFIQRFGMLLADTSASCYAWALLSNHLHLLVRTGRVPLSTLMRRLLTGYARHFNRRHRRHGYLFENRYKAILCEEEPYLLALVRYIHLNPLRAGIVEDLEALARYPWSGHSALMGKVPRAWQDTGFVLSRFAARRQSPEAYERFVAEGVTMGRRPDLVGGGLIRSVGGRSGAMALRGQGLPVRGDERILGSGSFVQAALRDARRQLEERARARASGVDLESLIDRLAGRLSLGVADLCSGSKQRRVVRGRASLCALAIDYLGVSGRELSRRLDVSPSAVCKLAQRGRRDPHTDVMAKAFFQAAVGEKQLEIDQDNQRLPSLQDFD